MLMCICYCLVMYGLLLMISKMYIVMYILFLIFEDWDF